MNLAIPSGKPFTGWDIVVLWHIKVKEPRGSMNRPVYMMFTSLTKSKTSFKEKYL